jgi:hypothetical protein
MFRVSTGAYGADNRESNAARGWSTIGQNSRDLDHAPTYNMI